ncbi:MAG: prpF [Ramlibacter sp.]|nr:prpF [Ramlibacter sp.]
MSAQIEVRATYMRGGTSKGVFFVPDDLPAAARNDAQVRDRLLLRVVGSPDPYEKHIDGMGGATSSTSKVVLVSRSMRPDCDVDFLFGAVDITQPLIDWSGNCGNLTTAVGPFAIQRGLVQAPRHGIAVVRIWQANIGKRIIASVPMQDGAVVETGSFELDGVPFPGAEIALEFLDPGGSDAEGAQLFPTGRAAEILDVPGIGAIEVTLITAGNPTVFVRADALGLSGMQMQGDVNGDPALLAKLEAIRAHGAVAMGLASSAQEATAQRPATPKIAFVSSPQAYRTSSGREMAASDYDLAVRILSMGKLHHAVTGTGAVATAAAAAISQTVVARAIAAGSRPVLRVGHPSGLLKVGAEVSGSGDDARVKAVRLSRTARRLMDGVVLVPPGF